MRVPWVVESLGVPFVFFHVYYPEYVLISVFSNSKVNVI